MASYHLKLGHRKKGYAKAQAEYICREGKYAKLRDGEEIVYVESGNMPYWAEKKPREFFAAADKYERENGRSCTTIIMAIPNELDNQAQIELVKEFVNRELGENLPYIFAIHNKPAEFDKTKKQPHVHLMFSERKLDGIERNDFNFFRKKNKNHPELGGCGKDRDWNKVSKLLAIRKNWEVDQNRYLEAAGINERVDCRNLKEISNEALSLGDLAKAEFYNRKPIFRISPKLLKAKEQNLNKAERLLVEQHKKIKEVKRLKEQIYAVDLTEKSMDIELATARAEVIKTAQKHNMDLSALSLKAEKRLINIVSRENTILDALNSNVKQNVAIIAMLSKPKGAYKKNRAEYSKVVAEHKNLSAKYEVATKLSKTTENIKYINSLDKDMAALVDKSNILTQRDKELRDVFIRTADKKDIIAAKEKIIAKWQFELEALQEEKCKLMNIVEVAAEEKEALRLARETLKPPSIAEKLAFEKVELLKTLGAEVIAKTITVFDEAETFLTAKKIDAYSLEKVKDIASNNKEFLEDMRKASQKQIWTIDRQIKVFEKKAEEKIIVSLLKSDAQYQHKKNKGDFWQNKKAYSANQVKLQDLSQQPKTDSVNKEIEKIEQDQVSLMKKIQDNLDKETMFKSWIENNVSKAEVNSVRKSIYAEYNAYTSQLLQLKEKLQDNIQEIGNKKHKFTNYTLLRENIFVREKAEAAIASANKFSIKEITAEQLKEKVLNAQLTLENEENIIQKQIWAVVNQEKMLLSKIESINLSYIKKVQERIEERARREHYNYGSVKTTSNKSSASGFGRSQGQEFRTIESRDSLPQLSFSNLDEATQATSMLLLSDELRNLAEQQTTRERNHNVLGQDYGQHEEGIKYQAQIDILNTSKAGLIKHLDLIRKEKSKLDVALKVGVLVKESEGVSNSVNANFEAGKLSLGSLKQMRCFSEEELKDVTTSVKAGIEEDKTFAQKQIWKLDNQIKVFEQKIEDELMLQLSQPKGAYAAVKADIWKNKKAQWDIDFKLKQLEQLPKTAENIKELKELKATQAVIAMTTKQNIAKQKDLVNWVDENVTKDQVVAIRATIATKYVEHLTELNQVKNELKSSIQELARERVTIDTNARVATILNQNDLAILAADDVLQIAHTKFNKESLTGFSNEDTLKGSEILKGKIEEQRTLLQKQVWAIGNQIKSFEQKIEDELMMELSRPKGEYKTNKLELWSNKKAQRDNNLQLKELSELPKTAENLELLAVLSVEEKKLEDVISHNLEKEKELLAWVAKNIDSKEIDSKRLSITCKYAEHLKELGSRKEKTEALVNALVNEKDRVETLTITKASESVSKQFDSVIQERVQQEHKEINNDLAKNKILAAFFIPDALRNKTIKEIRDKTITAGVELEARRNETQKQIWALENKEKAFARRIEKEVISVLTKGEYARNNSEIWKNKQLYNENEVKLKELKDLPKTAENSKAIKALETEQASITKAVEKNLAIEKELIERVKKTIPQEQIAVTREAVTAKYTEHLTELATAKAKLNDNLAAIVRFKGEVSKIKTKLWNKNGKDMADLDTKVSLNGAVRLNIKLHDEKERGWER